MRQAMVGLVATSIMAFSAAQAEVSVFELRISNETNSDLTFRLHNGQSKHSYLTYNDREVDEHTIKAGTYDVVGIKPTGNKCTLVCNGCTGAIGKVYAYYTDNKGDEQRSNYYEAKYEFFEYCGVAGNKPLTTYTSNWNFDHGTGKGTGAFDHTQKSSNDAYTSSDPAKGITYDAKYVSGHANITYTEKSD